MDIFLLHFLLSSLPFWGKKKKATLRILYRGNQILGSLRGNQKQTLVRGEHKGVVGIVVNVNSKKLTLGQNVFKEGPKCQCVLLNLEAWCSVIFVCMFARVHIQRGAHLLMSRMHACSCLEGIGSLCSVAFHLILLRRVSH